MEFLSLISHENIMYVFTRNKEKNSMNSGVSPPMFHLSIIFHGSSNEQSQLIFLYEKMNKNYI